jgi:hypothetical protein
MTIHQRAMGIKPMTISLGTGWLMAQAYIEEGIVTFREKGSLENVRMDWTWSSCKMKRSKNVDSLRK